MNLIKITEDNEISVHPFPEGTYSEQNKQLRALIGDDCDMYELVLPRRLYTEIGAKNIATKNAGEAISMLVDEEFAIKRGPKFNCVGSYLYETDKHGNPILGNILFVGEVWTGDGIDFCGIAESEFQKIYDCLNTLVEKARRK